jgi:hypothetical protein
MFCDEDSMSFDWYHRIGNAPWQMSACESHGAELVALGFLRGVSERRRVVVDAPNQCALCNGTTSIADVRACRCEVLGIPCPVHGPKPAGVAGDWSRVRCTKCGAELLLPADRIAFAPAASGTGTAVDVTGWAVRNGDGNELWCPFHGAARYLLEYVSGPGGEQDEPLDENEDDEDDEDDPVH